MPPLRFLRTAVALAVYVAAMSLSGCAKWVADRTVLFPSTDPLPTYGAVEAKVQTPVGVVRVFQAGSPASIGREPERFVLHLMGNASRAEMAATAVAARWGTTAPVEAWAVNYPGYGQSDGPAAIDKLVPAVDAVYDKLAERADGRPIYLDCDSLGTTLGLYLAATRRTDTPVVGLVLKNPPPLKRLILGRFGWWNLWLGAGPVARAIPAEIDSIANAKRAWAPALFVRAERDSFVTPHYQQRVVDAYAGRHRTIVLDDADHNTAISADEETAIREAIESFVISR